MIETAIKFLKKFPQTTEPAFYAFLEKQTWGNREEIKAYIAKIIEVSFWLGIIQKANFDELAIWVYKTPSEKLLNTFELLKKSI